MQIYVIQYHVVFSTSILTSLLGTTFRLTRGRHDRIPSPFITCNIHSTLLYHLILLCLGITLVQQQAFY